jgi:hypothetical protein
MLSTVLLPPELTAEETPDPCDSAAYMRMLEKAENDRNLDGAAFLDELGKVAKFCERQEKFHRGEVDAHFLARCIYVAEAYRRTVLPRAGNNTAKRIGGGFDGWCRQHGMHFRTARQLAHIGNSEDPVATIKALRKQDNARLKASRARMRIARKAISHLERQDPLERAWDAVCKLSSAQKLELLKRMFNAPSASAVSTLSQDDRIALQ